MAWTGFASSAPSGPISGTAVWRVAHKLNHCGTAEGALYRQGLGDFFLDRPHLYQAAFVVLKSPDIPSMLVETAYISNPTEEKRLRTRAHQERIANAIFSGVRDYFRVSPPDGTLYAQQKSRGGAAPIMAASAGP